MPNVQRMLLILIVLGSFGLRVWGIEFGLPFAYHPDEQQYILPGLGVVSGEFEPVAYYNPTLYPYFIGMIYSLTYFGLRTFGAFPDFFDLGNGWSQPMQPWITGVIFLARYLTAAVGMITTLIVYHIGRRAYSRTTGLAAAIMFGLAFLPTREAHFAVSDAPAALAVAVTLYLALNIVKRGYTVDYLWTGIGLGLAAATKYSAALLIVPIGLAHLVSHYYITWPQRLIQSWRGVLVGIVSVVSYLVVSPYTLLAWPEFWADFSENLQSAREGFQGLNLDPAGGAIFYLKSLIWGFGWPLFGLFLIAIVFFVWRRKRVDLVLLSLPLFGFWYMQRQEMYFVRWLMPFLPPLVVIAAETLHAATRKLIVILGQPASPVRTNQQFTLHRSVSIAITLALLLTLPSTYAAVQANRIFSQIDTRTAALDWMRVNVPPGSSVAAEVLSPPWGPPLALPGLDIGPYNFMPVPDGGIAEVDPQQYQAWGVQYIVASSFHYARPLRNQAHEARLAANLQTLEQQAELVAVFQPYSIDYTGFFYHDQVYGPANDVLYRRQPGPEIRIYRLPQE